MQKTLGLVDDGTRGRLEKTWSVYAQPHVSTYSITYERTASDKYLPAEEQVAANIFEPNGGRFVYRICALFGLCDIGYRRVYSIFGLNI